MKGIHFEQQGQQANVTVASGPETTTFVLSPHTDEEDAKIWGRLQAAANGIAEMSAGNLQFVELGGIGRGVRSADKPGVILFDRAIKYRDFMVIVNGRSRCDHPVTYCPRCGGFDVRHVNSITTVTTANESAPGDKGISMDLEEWQCHGVCKGRSFWA